MAKNKIKIVFLDAASVDLGDIDCSALKRQGDYQAYPQTQEHQILERCHDADIVITNKVFLHEKELKQLPRLKFIAVSATGYNNIDLKACEHQKIAVANVAGYSTASVSEQALLFLLNFSHRFEENQEVCVNGAWSKSNYYAELSNPYQNLAGKTLGIVGYGHIGKQLARVAKVLGMKILIAKIPGRKYSDALKRVSLKELCSKSDYISLHCPLSKETQHLFNAKVFADMKRKPYLLNLARGPIVNETDVLKAIHQNLISGYATDVLEQEPPPANHPFFQKKYRHKILLSPHIAWASQESRQNLVNEIAENIAAFKKKKKRNRIV